MGSVRVYVQGRMRGSWRFAASRSLAWLGYLSPRLAVRLVNRLLAGVRYEYRIEGGRWRPLDPQPRIRVSLDR